MGVLSDITTALDNAGKDVGHLIYDVFGGGRSASRRTVAEDMDTALGPIIAAIRELWAAALQEAGALKWAQEPARQIGKDLEDMMARQDESWARLTDTILPHSLGHAVGYVFSTGIVPLRQQVGRLERRVSFLEGWRGQIDNWRNHYVDPQIQDWRLFHDWFNKHAAPVIATVQDWLDHPGHFATWAVPILGDPLTVWFVHQASQAVQDAVTTVVVDSSPDVWRHVEAAAVAILHQEQ